MRHAPGREEKTARGPAVLHAMQLERKHNHRRGEQDDRRNREGSAPTPGTHRGTHLVVLGSHCLAARFFHEVFPSPSDRRYGPGELRSNDSRKTAYPRVFPGAPPRFSARAGCPIPGRHRLVKVLSAVTTSASASRVRQFRIIPSFSRTRLEPTSAMALYSRRTR